jgi:hypothetical protein
MYLLFLRNLSIPRIFPEEVIERGPIENEKKLQTLYTNSISWK